MHTLLSFDYAVIRVVPRVDREEFLNAGIILFCLERRFLRADIYLAEQRLQAVWPAVDLATILLHLQSFPKICAGGPGSGVIGSLSQRERFHWLVAPRSTMIQVSPVHTGLCENPEMAVESLVDQLVLV